jgi:hypothetical protein
VTAPLGHESEIGSLLAMNFTGRGKVGRKMSQKDEKMQAVDYLDDQSWMHKELKSEQ